MLAAEVTKEDLFRACESLFGTEIDVSVEFLRYLKPTGVKAAYRRKAMETHPDRSIIIAGKPDFMEKRFKEINLAYQMLQEFLAHPWKYSLDEKGKIYERRQSAPRPSSHAKPTQTKTEPLYAGLMPSRKLLFGQYLYYSGHISFPTLIKAIVWQRLQRPTVGAIAVSWGWMEGSNILDILRARRYGEKFGDCALRCGYLSRPQIMHLLDKQRKVQPRIGKYFVEQNIMPSHQIFQYIVAMQMHNNKHHSYI